MSMNSSTMSLEEIFLEVTSKADDDQAEEDKENKQFIKES